MDAVCTKRGKNEMDYVTHLKSDGTYQPLREHEENVAALAGEFAAAFGAQEHGHRTGLLHDIGKYSDNGQNRRARSWRRGWAITMLRVPWRVITAVCRTGETTQTTAAERFVLG